MKPLRISVEGFMCYRDKQTATFDGAKLWVLSGPNGSGKSALFDAMTFALYGIFRGEDKRRAGKTLINHQCDKLWVEFDFAVGEQQYRVQRTASHKGRPTFSAIYLNPLGGVERHEPEVTDDDTLKDWVVKTIGLDEKAFLASVLLRQGRADVLLTAKSAEKRDILGQLINISAYQALYEKAKDLRSRFEADVRSCQRHLAELPRAEPADLARLELELAETEATLSTLQRQLSRYLSLKNQAVQWVDWSRRQVELTQKLQASKVLLAQAAEINTRAARNEELSRVLPTLKQIWEWRQSVAQMEVAWQGLNVQWQEQAIRLDAQKTQHESLEEQLQASLRYHSLVSNCREAIRPVRSGRW